MTVKSSVNLHIYISTTAIIVYVYDLEFALYIHAVGMLNLSSHFRDE